MKITQLHQHVEVQPEDVKHGDIIKFTSKDLNGITTEKSGTVQFIVFNARTNGYLFYTEGFRDSYDNSDYLLGGGRDVLTRLGHVDSPLDTAEVGDSFDVTQTKYVRNETLEKLEDGWWISRFKINNKAGGREVYSESEAREWFRRNDAKLIKANVEKTADGKVVESGKSELEEKYSVDGNIYFPEVTRVEVISEKRDLIAYGTSNVWASVQDDNRTLKVFMTQE